MSVALHDDTPGIDFAAFRLTLNGTEVVLVPGGGGSDMTFATPAEYRLPTQTSCTVLVDSADLAGNSTHPYAFVFRTGGTLPPATNLPPGVASNFPADGATNVDPAVRILVVLTDAAPGVDPASVVVRLNGVPCAVSSVTDGWAMRVTATPASRPAWRTLCSVTVDAEDLSGVAMATFSFSFTTAASDAVAPPPPPRSPDWLIDGSGLFLVGPRGAVLLWSSEFDPSVSSVHCRLFGAMGETIQETDLVRDAETADGVWYEIPVLAAGVYFLEVTPESGPGKTIGKLVVIR
jgi:hypothetical protein